MSKSELIAAGKHLDLVRRNGWEYATRHKATGVVAILAETSGGELILTEQQRTPVQVRVVDLPAGLVGDGGDGDESLLSAAARELEEETGFISSRWSVIAVWPTSPGLTDEVVTVIRAEAATRKGHGGGVDGENIEVHLIPRATVASWLSTRRSSGILIDPKVYAALYLTI